jgi:hypothetical protein
MKTILKCLVVAALSPVILVLWVINVKVENEYQRMQRLHAAK